MAMSLASHQTSDQQSHSPASGLGRNRDFLLLFTAQVISLLGSGVTTVALALFAYELTGGKDATVVVANALPPILAVSNPSFLSGGFHARSG
jgi:hypothetical protein